MSAEMNGFLEDLVSSKTAGDWIEAFENYVDCLPSTDIEYVGLDETSFLAERGGKLVLSFELVEDILSESHDSFPLGWVEARENNWSYLGVISHGNNLRRPNDVVTYLRKLIEAQFFDVFEEVVFIGAKQSSQLALECSKLCQNSKLVLVQPETDEERFSVEMLIPFEKSRPNTAEPSKTAIVASDFCEQEFVERISDEFQGEVIFLKCHHMGNRTHQFLRTFGLMADLVQIPTNPEFQMESFYTSLRKEKRASRAYWRNVLRNLDTIAKPALSRALCESVHSKLGGRVFRRELQRLSETPT